MYVLILRFEGHRFGCYKPSTVEPRHCYGFKAMILFVVPLLARTQNVRPSNFLGVLLLSIVFFGHCSLYCTIYYCIYRPIINPVLLFNINTIYITSYYYYHECFNVCCTPKLYISSPWDLAQVNLSDRKMAKFSWKPRLGIRTESARKSNKRSPKITLKLHETGNSANTELTYQKF